VGASRGGGGRAVRVGGVEGERCEEGQWLECSTRERAPQECSTGEGVPGMQHPMQHVLEAEQEHFILQFADATAHTNTAGDGLTMPLH
jgi:hypothetical protein